MNTIEFRVSGPSRDAVAGELAKLMKNKFDVDSVVRPAPSPPPADPGTKVDPAHVALFIAEVIIHGFHAYQVFVRHPAEEKRQRYIRNWDDVVSWATKQLPTTIRAAVGANEVELHLTDGEKLHHLTERAAKATIVPE
ncbi:MAG TPA: hypothetical protein VD866_07095 [Urbifossiella sp.]|nr:hypothetical protein [Urbifossiella sp.]